MNRRAIPTAIAAATTLALTFSVGLAAGSSQQALAVRVLMSGANEVVASTSCAPPLVCGDPDASGTAIIIVVPANDLVCWKLTWEGIEEPVIAAHIHGPGTTTQQVGVLVPLTTDPAMGCTHDSDADAIAANPAMYYVNVHSTAFPVGAIRAQLG